MPDFTIRLRPKINRDTIPEILRTALATQGLFEGSEYDLIESELLDPLLKDSPGDVPSSRHTYFMKKLYASVTTRLTTKKEISENFWTNAAIAAIRFELAEDESGTKRLTKRRTSDIIETLKDIEAEL